MDAALAYPCATYTDRSIYGGIVRRYACSIGTLAIDSIKAGLARVPPDTLPLADDSVLQACLVYIAGGAYYCIHG